MKPSNRLFLKTQKQKAEITIRIAFSVFPLPTLCLAQQKQQPQKHRTGHGKRNEI